MTRFLRTVCIVLLADMIATDSGMGLADARLLADGLVSVFFRTAP